eukprot:scaffold14376_cov108-Isochrysis_galbana.AAC.4
MYLYTQAPSSRARPSSGGVVRQRAPTAQTNPHTARAIGGTPAHSHPKDEACGSMPCPLQRRREWVWGGAKTGFTAFTPIAPRTDARAQKSLFEQGHSRRIQAGTLGRRAPGEQGGVVHSALSPRRRRHRVCFCG